MRKEYKRILNKYLIPSSDCDDCPHEDIYTVQLPVQQLHETLACTLLRFEQGVLEATTGYIKEDSIRFLIFFGGFSKPNILHLLGIYGERNPHAPAGLIHVNHVCAEKMLNWDCGCKRPPKLTQIYITDVNEPNACIVELQPSLAVSQELVYICPIQSHCGCYNFTSSDTVQIGIKTKAVKARIKP